MLEVVEHAVGALEARDGAWVERVMLLQPTCPFRSPALLRGALDLLERPGTEGVIGVTAIERSLSVMYREDNDGLLTALATWDDRTRRQDVRPLLTPNGTMYLVRRDALRAHRRLFPPRLRSVRTTRLEAIDIDTPDDWALAEAVVAAGLAAPCA